ncbi:hypothetical protein UPYG_G00065540 [Umbra pygmaea]|uniref:Chemokine interleukin-8-like domain-containing protein n=1 Tax=Umbra pygmaea TaxID=75934 RepID=A0ABD0XE03_UMBPY
MAFTPHVCYLFLVLLLGVSMHSYGAQHIIGARCKCEGTIMNTLETIVDFEIIEPKFYCNKTEIIVKLQEDGVERCLNREGSLAKNLVRCWTLIRKNNKHKNKCLKRK